MNYEILYDEGTLYRFLVIQRDAYSGENEFSVHSRHQLLEAAELVKEALEARQRAKNDRT